MVVKIDRFRYVAVWGDKDGNIRELLTKIYRLCLGRYTVPFYMEPEENFFIENKTGRIYNPASSGNNNQ